MSKIKTVIIVLLIIVLAAYAIHMNIQLKNTINQYEASALKMTEKFESINEDILKAREEIARQKALNEEVNALKETVRTQAAKMISEARQEAARPVYQKPAEPAKMSKKEQIESEAKKKADKAKVEAEALLGQVSTTPNAWEEREAHL